MGWSTTESMTCATCGHQNDIDARFCNECGASLSSGCPTCAARNRPGARFCSECGTSLTGLAPGPGNGSPSRPTEPPAGSLGVTERRIVSVLFADLVGFTALSDERDPEAVREFLDGYFTLARERIDRYGGTIEKFIGDAVMAVWGTPVSHEDDAERAVRAAVELLDAVGGMRAPDGSTVSARCGVVTGEAAVTTGADGQGMVAGDVVNTASRLQSVAPAGTVLVGEATVRASESAIAYEPVGEQSLRGKQLPIPAWRAARVVAGRGGSGRSTRLEAPFVGRDDELRLLKDLLHATARERRARLVSVLGIPGIGKSRLTWELEKYVDGLVEGIYWHQGRSSAYGDGLAFWALAEMVRSRARIAESDPPDVARQKLAEMTLEYLRDPQERARVEPTLVALLGLGAPAAGNAAELTAGWRTLFERIADRGPTVLVFEDLHWADPGLIDFIEGLLSSARNRPLMVLALAHADLIDERPTFGATVRNHTRLDLTPLGDDAMDLMLLGLVPGIPQAALRVIRDRAAGVPLYAVETVRMLLDQDRLVEVGGRYRLDADLAALAVPDSLQALIGARLDTLDDPSRQLLGVAAVLGLSFSVEPLAAVLDRPAAEVRTSLDRLVAREILVLDDSTISAERGQYRFIQGVLQEVAYARLSRRDRVTRHLKAARWFEGTGNDELAGIVASHYLSALRSAPDDADLAALSMRAATASEAAADRARTIGAHSAAAAHLGDAIALATDEDARLRLMEAGASSLADAGELAEAEQVARVVMDSGFARREYARAARAATILVHVILGSGRPTVAEHEATSARSRLGPELEQDPDVIRLAAELARAMLMNGDHASARTLIESILPIADRSGLRPIVGELLASRGWALAVDGRALEATALLRGAVVFAEQECLFGAEMRSRMNLSSFLGDESPSEAFDVALAGVRRAEERGHRSWSTALAGNAADGAFSLGEWDWIESIAQELDSMADWRSPWDFAVPRMVVIIRAHRGQHAEASELLGRFDRLFPALTDPQVQFAVDSTRIQSAWAAGDIDEALRLGRALQLPPSTSGRYRWLYGSAIAIEGRDRGALDEIVAVAARSRETGMLAAIAMDLVGGAARALDDDPAGLPQVDAALDRLRAARVRFELAVALRLRAMLAPDSPGSALAAQEARSILSSLGALALLRGLPDATPDTPTSGAMHGTGASVPRSM